VQQLSETVRDEVPRGMVHGKLRGGHAGARLDGGPRREALDAVIVVRTYAAKGVARLAHDPDVSELGVIHAEQRLAANDAADADAGAHGDVREIVQRAARAPAAFRKRRAVHVGVEAHGNAGAPAETARDVGIAPAGLRRRRDETLRRGIGAQIDGPERGDTERARGAVLLAPAVEHRLDLPQGLFAFAGRQPLDGAHVLGTGAEDAHALGAAELDTRE
jgi:hypothetical protein